MQQECVREQYVARADENAQCRNTGKIGMFRAQLGVIEGGDPPRTTALPAADLQDPARDHEVQ